jgi:hypothetical protein
METAAMAMSVRLNMMCVLVGGERTLELGT